ncbi:MAG: glycogen debranching enzyme N-terminal domain-containing protein [Candidatus Bathyarchaeota archaeon]
MGLPKISIGQNILSNVDDALTREWLVTNGLGGYASSTVLGVNTRKYHGLLVAAFNPPINRWISLTKLDETFQIGDKNYDLATNEFQDTFHPKGHVFLSNFSVSPFPKFTYAVQGVTLEKTVFMPHLKNVTVVIYKVSNTNDRKVSVFVSPFVNSRHIYNITKKSNINWNLVQTQEDTINIQPDSSVSSLVLSCDNGSFMQEPWWVEKLFYRVDSSRAESCLEDNYRPGYFRFIVEPNETKQFHVLAVTAKTYTDAQSLFSKLLTLI